MSVMPPEITYGYVADRLVLAVGDGADGDRTPDARPAVGKVKFTPKTKVMPVSSPTPGRVLPQAIEASLDADGYLIDDQGALGVWLVVGLYDVTYSFTAATVPGHEIEVTTAHTEAAPLYLTLAVPPGGPILTPSQYTELNDRLLIVEAAGPGGTGAVSSVNGQTGAVVLDAAAVSALPSTYTPPAQSWTQITSKPATFTPTAHVHAIADVTGLQAALDGKAATAHTHSQSDVTGLSTALAGKAPTAHTHGAADLTGVVKTVNGTAPDGAGNVTVAAGGGGASTQTVAGVGVYFLSPWIVSTIDKPVSALTVMGYVPAGGSVTIDTVSVYVFTAQAGAVGTIEVYADSSLNPGSLVATSPALDFATVGRRDWTTTQTGTGWWFKVTSTVTNVRLMAGSAVGPGAGVGTTSPSVTMPDTATQYPMLGGTRTNSFVPLVMLHRSA